MDKERIDAFIEELDDQESFDYLLKTMTQSKKIDFLHHWLHENLLTRHEAREYTNQSDNGIRQSILNHLLIPFFSKGEKQGKVRLFLKKDAIQYGKAKKQNVPRKPELK